MTLAMSTKIPCTSKMNRMSTALGVHFLYRRHVQLWFRECAGFTRSSPGPYIEPRVVWHDYSLTDIQVTGPVGEVRRNYSWLVAAAVWISNRMTPDARRSFRRRSTVRSDFRSVWSIQKKKKKRKRNPSVIATWLRWTSTEGMDRTKIHFSTVSIFVLFKIKIYTLKIDY